VVDARLRERGADGPPALLQARHAGDRRGRDGDRVGSGVAAGGARAQQRPGTPAGWIEVESQNRPEAAVDRGDEIEQELKAEASEADAARWHPVWFDRGSGWTGKTHGEADGFCYCQGGMIVCPYDAVSQFRALRRPRQCLSLVVPVKDLIEWLDMTDQDRCFFRGGTSTMTRRRVTAL
ncbi:hypothetical protein THAOC_23562, partial [Thalassiosira oceanica]